MNLGSSYETSEAGFDKMLRNIKSECRKFVFYKTERVQIKF